ncbi:MAG: tandem-95 repeat protein [Candidatus Cloacimonetes bacterium]|nr:tandem-95 repeat protein [Candidatus Cloacimonadota bacterium]
MKMLKCVGLVVFLVLFVSLAAVAPEWEVIPGTQYSMQVYSQVDFMAQYFTNSNPENIVAAFGPGGESDCRAIAFWNEYNQYQLWYMTIVSNAEPGDNEIITYKIYDAAGDQVLDCRESSMFVDNIVIGSYDDTFLLTIPYVIDDMYGAYEDSLLYISTESGVLINDYINLDYLDEFWVVLAADVDNGVLNFNDDGSFTYQPNLNYFGNDFFEYYATDGDYETSNALVEIQVQPVNDPPTINLPDEGFSFQEDTVYQVDFTEYIFDVDNTILTLSYSNNQQIQVSITGYNVTFTPQSGFNGIEYITFTINDNTARAIASDTVPVEVTSVNDPPVVANPIPDFSFNEDTSDEHLSLGYIFSDPDGDVLEYGFSNNINLNIAIDGYGLVTITNQPNWFGTETIIFSASDAEYTVYDTVNVTVNPVNDPPELIIEFPDLFLTEDFVDYQINLLDYFTDVDNVSLTYSVQFNNDHVLISIVDTLLTINSVPNWTGTTNVVVSASDDFTRFTTSDNFQITVSEVNDPPVVITPLPDTPMQEDAAAISRNLNNFFYDYDNDPLVYTVQFNNMQMNAWIVDNMLYFQPVTNWFGTSPITVIAADAYGEISDTFNAIVNPVNDPPYVYEFIPDQLKEEGFADFSLNLYDYFADVDNDILSFSASLSTQNTVVINIVDEIMTISSVPQWNGLVDVTVTAQDEFGLRLTASDTFTIEVMPVNDPPVLVSPMDDYNKLEDFIPFDIDLSTYFSDPENDLLTYTADYNSSQIGISIVGNVMTVNSVFNWNGNASVTVYASDNVPLNDPASDTFLIIVQPVNDPPFVSDPIDDYNVFEDFTAFDINLNAHFYDYDNTLSFSVELDANIIQAYISYGTLYISPLPNVSGNVEITVTADDGVRATAQDAFWVNIQPVNDPPTIALPDSIAFYEDNILVIDFDQYITDVDSDILILTANGNTNVLIDIDGLMVTFSNLENWNGTEFVTFNVFDGEYNAEDMVTVIVLPEADALTITLPTSFSFDEDETLDVNFASYISNPDGFDLVVTAEDNSMITVDVSGLNVTLGAYPNWNGSEMINFIVSNANGPEFSNDYVNVIVNPVNDAPTVTPIPDQYILEDAPTQVINLNDYFADVDGDVLQYSASYETQNIVVTISYPNLYFTPQENWYGTTPITVSAQDDYRYLVSDVFDVIVEPVNDPPYIVNYFDDITRDEDFQPFTIDFAGYFADVDDAVLEYSIDFNSDNVDVVLNGTVLEIAPVLNWNGLTNISVTANDGHDRLSVTDQFQLTVNPVNDPPYIAVPLPDRFYFEDFDNQYINLNEYFADDDNGLVYSVDYTASEITANVIGNLLEITSIDNWNGETIISVTANDQQLRAFVTDEFVVTVYPVNDAPVVLTALEDIIINEDTVSDPVDLDTKFFDVDGDLLSYSAMVSDPNGIVNIAGNIMTVTAVENWFGPFDAYITADDLMGRAVVTDTIHVVVMPVNDPPYIITPLDDLEFTEDFAPYSYDLAQNFGDIECDQLFYNATFNNLHIALMLNGSEMLIHSVPDWTGVTEVTIFASDQLCRLVVTDTFLVTVNGVNDPPYLVSNISDQFRDEDFETYSIDLNLYFADVDGDLLSYSATAADSIVMLDIQDNLLEISSILNLNGNTEITVVAEDGYNRLSASDIFIMNVSPVNDPPLLMLPPQYDFDEDTSLVIDLIDEGCVCDIDTPPEELELNALGANHVIIDIVGTIVTFSADVNWFGTEIITFSLTDESRFVVYDTVNVVVNPVNDVPFFQFLIPDQQILEGNLFNPINLNYYITDVDDPDPTLIWEYSGNVDLNVDINPVTHFATVTAPYPDWNGDENITFTVYDSYMASTSDIVNFQIIPVNDAPVVQTPIPDQYVEINFAPFDIVLSDHFYDVDGDMLTYYVDFNDQEISATESDGLLSISSIINWYGVSQVIVTADDNVNRATVSDTFLVDITYTITQYLDLNVMWNWISFYVQPEDYSLGYVFGPLGDNVNTVKYQTESADYYPDLYGWFGDLEFIIDGGGYLVNVTDPAPGFSLTGNRIMSDTPIEMIADWNWIAYYPPEIDSLSSALFSILDNVQIVKNQTQSAEYFPEVGNGIWFGDLQTMAPGIGYKIQMENPDVLVYPLYPVVTRNQNYSISMPDNSPAEWEIIPGNSDNMILMLSAEYNDETFEWAEGRAMGIFDADDNCRAHGIWQESEYLDQGFWYFTIVGDNAGDPLYIRLLDENNIENTSLDMITFQADSKIGSPFEPYLAVFYPVEEEEHEIVPVNALNQNYPNPFNPETTICFELAAQDYVTLNIFNLRGEKIKALVREPREAGSYSVVWDGTNDNGNQVASGIYFYSISTSQYSATRKMVMIK